MPAEVIRLEQLNVRLNPDEMKRAKWLASHYGVTPANVVRMLLAERARELGYAGTDAPAERKTARKR